MLAKIENSESFVSPVIFDQDDNPSLYFASPIYTGVYTGQLDPAGILVMRLDASILQTILVNSVGVAGPDSFGILLDENHQYLAHGTAPNMLYKTIDSLPEAQVNTLQSQSRLSKLSSAELSGNLPELDQKLNAADSESNFTIDNVSSVEGTYLVAVQPLQTQPWLMAFFEPQEILLLQLEQQNQAALVLVLVIVAIVTGLSTGISRLLTTPILKLTDLVQQITKGDLTIQVPIETEDEIGSLGQAFNMMTSQLSETLESLEERVAERTQALEERTSYLEASGEISQAAATILDPDALIQQVVDLIKNRLDLYYVGLFLVDDDNQWAVLQAGTGEAGSAMLAENHRLKLGEGMIGWCITNDQARIALDVGEDAVRFENPFLPETRSEGALPLRSRNRVIGALSVQSSKPAAFDQEIITVFQTMADQVAIALDNAELFARSEQALEAERRAYGELSREAWKELLTTQADLGTLSTMEQPLRTPQGNWTTEMKAAAKTGEITRGDAHSLAIPIILRDQILGVVRLKKQSEAPPWSDGEIELMDALVDQLEVALESARLFSDTQKQFVRERMTTEITDKIHRSLDLDLLMQTLLDELSNALDVDDAFIQLGNPSEIVDSGNGEQSS